MFMTLAVSPMNKNDLCELIDEADRESQNYLEGLLQEMDDHGFTVVWAARYSAPGYLDCTDFVFSFRGPIAAAKECFETYGDDIDPDCRDDLATVIRQARAQGFRR